MGRILFWVFVCICTFLKGASSCFAGEPRSSVSKTENWNRIDSESSVNSVTISSEGINFYSSAEGLYINLPKAITDIKLFSLTGEVVWGGSLVQGRFFIPLKQGLYFLRINNKSYKVVCK